MASSSARPSIRSERQPPGSRARTKPPKRSATAASPRHNVDNDDDSDCSRVRVAVRLRPKNAEDPLHDMDSAYCIELQPEVKRLKLRKNNWSFESYKFDEVFTENASQKRVYEVVAKPVVEGVLNGYNGTVMAYGQTGTGKTYTVGHLGKVDPSQRGIMVRAMEDILSYSSSSLFTVGISYVQLYLESVQDLLDTEKNNLLISEDPKTGEISLPGASVVHIDDLDHFLRLLQVGEANRYAANTKLNTESSRSHAILMIYIQRHLKDKESGNIEEIENNVRCDLFSKQSLPLVLKSKLLIVDLAGSERIDKSGSEGRMLEEAKFINLSLSSLGKCINALAENSTHIPSRDSKLTRLLRDSFGGSARTSLIITIGPSPDHHAETSSTIQFGQRAMKVINMLKLKEEVDYEVLCRKLEIQIDNLSMEAERQQRRKNDENALLEKKLKEFESNLQNVKNDFSMKCECLSEENVQLQLENRNLLEALNLQKTQCNLMHDEITHLKSSLDQCKQELLENSTHEEVLSNTTQKYEKNVMELSKQLEDEHSLCESLKVELAKVQQKFIDSQKESQTDKLIHKLKMDLQVMYDVKERALNEIAYLKEENGKYFSEKALLKKELECLLEKLSEEVKQRKLLEDDIVGYKSLCFDIGPHLEEKGSFSEDSVDNANSRLGGARSLSKSNKQRETIFKILQEVGLGSVLALLRSVDQDVQIHAAKAVANLASEDSNQEKIAVEGGLDILISLLGSSKDRTVLRLASVAIANLAMNGVNQGLIMSKGGGRLLSNLAYKTNDLQTLRMLAGAIANLCGNEKLHAMLKKDGATKALLEMSKFDHKDVIAQVARGIANFAKCESRERSKGKRKGKSLLLDDGVLQWIVSNTSKAFGSTRRHMELALCHLAQNEHNASDLTSSGAIKELLHMSDESLEEDVRNLAKTILDSNPTLLADIQCI